MGLSTEYSQRFLILWPEYPKFPVGRSKKLVAYKAYQQAEKRCGFTDEDVETIRLDIVQRKRFCVTWQSGNKYGPPAMSTYFNQELWNEPYQKIRSHPSHKQDEVSAPVWQQRGFISEDDYKRATDAAAERAFAQLRRLH